MRTETLNCNNGELKVTIAQHPNDWQFVTMTFRNEYGEESTYSLHHSDLDRITTAFEWMRKR